MLDALGQWSKLRLFWTLLIGALLFLEVASWITSQIPFGCFVREIANTNNAQYYKCATLHVVLIELAAIVGEEVGRLDTWFFLGTIFLGISAWEIIASLCDIDGPFKRFGGLNSPDKFSLLLVTIMFLQLVTFMKTDRTLALQDRAWLGPVDAALDGPLQPGKPFGVLIVFENSGKEPAVDVFNTAGAGITLPFSAEEAAQQQRTGPFGGSATDACANVVPREGYPAIFPNVNRPLQANIQQAFVADDAIIGGGRTFFVHGCAAYRTLGKPHVSEYCFWLGPRIDEHTGLRKFQPCLGSFRAD